ncbi:MAG TPA: sporulation protein [Acidimicrobiia bacterium]|nr:sporulation protein [Acidimicrobiia bacterium]
MDVPEGLKGTYDAVTVRRVYGDPIERDGVMLIPAAAVVGGVGFGGGNDGNGAQGGGGGSGISARPVGVYKIVDGKVTWEPAIDLTRVIVGGQVVAIAFLLMLRSALRKHRRKR